MNDTLFEKYFDYVRPADWPSDRIPRNPVSIRLEMRESLMDMDYAWNRARSSSDMDNYNLYMNYFQDAQERYNSQCYELQIRETCEVQIDTMLYACLP